jgi:hypothetical protein
MATITKGKTFISGETVEPADLHQLVDSATISNILASELTSSVANLLITTGTTAQRPASPVLGQTYFNTTLNVLEFYNGTDWFRASSVVRSDQQILTFNSSTTWTVPTGITNVAQALVVAGGGGGGSTYGGGGGAGGVLYTTNLAVTPGAVLTVTVGAGGVGGLGFGNSTPASATNGGNSVFGSLTAIGGGFGSQDYPRPNPNGGSGGSGGGGIALAGTGTAGQGFAGGAGINGLQGGGGGGAGEPAANAVTFGIGTNGGRGIPNPISGSTAGQLVNGVYYLGGGGGSGGDSGGSNGTGGLGGGGNGVNSGNGTAGTANTGGGGGGGAYDGSGAAGGSGIVILRYPSGFTATFSGGVTQTTTTVGSDKVSTITAAGVADTVTFN